MRLSDSPACRCSYPRRLAGVPWPLLRQAVIGKFRSVCWVLWLGTVCTSVAQAQLAEAELRPEAAARVQAAFTPGDDVAGMMVAAIGQARRQVLVQAFSFTHEGIARALVAAQRRGVEVRVIADRTQTENMEHGQTPALAHAGIPVWLDGEHQSAHNKVMVIDAGQASALLITGSFNFTRAAQYKNAENMLFIRDSDALVQAYARNWQQHLAHSSPFRLH